MKKRIIIEIEPKEGTEDNRIKEHILLLLSKIEGWAKDNFQNTPKVFLEEENKEK